MNASAIAEDLTGVEAVRAVKRLQHAWGHYAEAGDYTAMADLFSEDGRLVWGEREAVGSRAILSLIIDEIGGGEPDPAGGRLNARLLLSPVVTISPDRRSARGRWHELAMLGRHGVHAGWSGGIQENEYVSEGGTWRIARLEHHPQFAGHQRDGWRNLIADTPVVPFHFTPDGAGTPVPPPLGRADPAWTVDMSSRAEGLMDESIIHNLLAAYGQYVDRKLWDDVTDLFDTSGALSWGEERWEGRGAIRRGLERYSPAGLRQGEFHDHLQLMPIVSMAPDGGSADVRVIELQTVAKHGKSAHWGIRIGQGRVTKGSGTWRISELAYVQRLWAEHEQGWDATVAGEGPWSYPQHTGPVPAFAHPTREPARRPQRTAPDLDAAELRRTVDAALSFDAAENVACAYGYYLDEAHWDETADLFAHDGWKELSFVGTYIGRERIRDSLVARYGRTPRRPGFLPIHQKTQPFISVLDDGRVCARLKMLQVNSGWDTEASMVAGVYEEQMVLEDGIWRIAGMDLEYIVVAGWAGAWATVTPDAGRRFAPSDAAVAAFDPAPDAPLRGLRFAPFPEIGPLGFHYANPVSQREPAVRFTWSDGRFGERAQPGTALEETPA